MAPQPTQVLDETLRSTIHDLFSIQSSIHGYQGSATQRTLIDNFTSLHANLTRISTSAAPLASRPIPPEIMNYIDEARNPDIYTREFVELTQKGNKYLHSKAAAYARMGEELARQMAEEWPEMRGVVGRVMSGRGEGVDGLEELGDDMVVDGKKEEGEGAVAGETDVLKRESPRPEESVPAEKQESSFTLPGL